VTALATRESAEGRRAATREITERLGCTVDEAEQLLKDAREREDEKLSEADKKLKEAEARDTAAATREAAAVARERKANIRDALGEATVRADRRDLAMDTLLTRIPVDADDAGITAAVTALKEATPEWFTTTPDPNAPKTTPKATPTTDPPAQPKPTGTPEDDKFDAGAERAKTFRPRH
jgi:hypothetical protein